MPRKFEHAGVGARGKHRESLRMLCLCQSPGIATGRRTRSVLSYQPSLVTVSSETHSLPRNVVPQWEGDPQQPGVACTTEKVAANEPCSGCWAGRFLSQYAFDQSSRMVLPQPL